jgi:hypothetical protein
MTQSASPGACLDIVWDPWRKGKRRGETHRIGEEAVGNRRWNGWTRGRHGTMGCGHVPTFPHKAVSGSVLLGGRC